MTYTIRLFNFLIFFSFLSCNKEENKKDIVKEAIVFPDLGEDGPYNYGQTYQGRNGYTTYYPGNIPSYLVSLMVVIFLLQKSLIELMVLVSQTQILSNSVLQLGIIFIQIIT